MKALLLLFALAIVVSRVSAAEKPRADRPCLVPWPANVTMRAGTLAVPAHVSIEVTGENSAAALAVAKTFADDLREIGFTPSVTHKPNVSGPKIALKLSANPSLGKEGYWLRVNGDIRITAAADTGLFWGTRTALQLLAKGPGTPVPNLTIDDRPQYGYRGVLVDVARHFHSMDFHRQMIKRLASYKINIYHIHFDDDQSYTLPSDKYPNLPTPGRHYTKDELKELVKLAAQYHVTIVPEIEMPSHNSALCAAIPDVVCRGKQPGFMVCGSSDRCFEVLKTLVSEAVDIFPGPYFHIGADESDLSVWDNCPDCEATKAKENLKDNEALFHRFINRMNGFVRSKGRKTIIWEGFKVGQEPVVDKDIMVEEFAVEYAMPGDLLNAGYDLVNAACVPLYIVQHWAVTASPPESLAEWNALYFAGGHPPKRLDQMTKVTPSPRLKGVCFCSWENEERAEEAAMFGTGTRVATYTPAPRVQITAERAWTGSATTAQDLLKRTGVVK